MKLTNKFSKKLLVGAAIIVTAVVTAVALAAWQKSSQTVVNESSQGTGSSEISFEDNLDTSSIPLSDSSPTVVQNSLSSLKSSDGYKNARADIPYAELFRNAEKYKGQWVKYTGNVIQVLGESGNWNLRVNITKETIGTYESWDDTVYVFSYSPERVIEKDIIEFTALVNGTITYESVLGGKITIPSLTIYEHALVGRSQ